MNLIRWSRWLDGSLVRGLKKAANNSISDFWDIRIFLCSFLIPLNDEQFLLFNGIHSLSFNEKARRQAPECRRKSKKFLPLECLTAFLLINNFCFAFVLISSWTRLGCGNWTWLNDWSEKQQMRHERNFPHFPMKFFLATIYLLSVSWFFSFFALLLSRIFEE